MSALDPVLLARRLCQVNERRTNPSWSRISWTLSSGDGVPGDERARPQEPLVAGAKQMPSDGEEVPNDAVDGEEPLGLRHGFEAPHVCLTTARGLMRDFGPVVGIARHVMDDERPTVSRSATRSSVAERRSRLSDACRVAVAWSYELDDDRAVPQC